MLNLYTSVPLNLYTFDENVDNFKPQKTIILREIPKFAVLDKKD